MAYIDLIQKFLNPSSELETSALQRTRGLRQVFSPFCSCFPICKMYNNIDLVCRLQRLRGFHAEEHRQKGNLKLWDTRGNTTYYKEIKGKQDHLSGLGIKTPNCNYYIALTTQATPKLLTKAHVAY